MINGWELIATYPMDGSKVLVFFSEYAAIDVASRHTGADDTGWWASIQLDFDLGFDDHLITHWMPIPEDGWISTTEPPEDNQEVLVRGHNAWVVEPAFIRDGLWYRAHHQIGDLDQDYASRLSGNTDAPEEWHPLPSYPI